MRRQEASGTQRGSEAVHRGRPRANRFVLSVPLTAGTTRPVFEDSVELKEGMRGPGASVNCRPLAVIRLANIAATKRPFTPWGKLTPLLIGPPNRTECENRKCRDDF